MTDSADSSSSVEQFVRLLEPAVRRAAGIARSLEGRVPNLPKAGESTRVKQALTEADTLAQEALLPTLREHFPSACLAAEEDTPGVAAFPTEGDELVVIDPIDGTLHSYLERRGPYAVMVGLAVGGEYQAGLVALPREGLLFGGTRGAGAWCARAGGSPRPARARADANRILVSHGMPRAVTDQLEARGFEVIPACGGAVSVAPLILGVRAGVRYAPGDLGISIRGRIGIVIAAEAGAYCKGSDGGDFPLDLATPAPTLRVAATEGDLDVLAEALAAADLLH